jgi:hypothetical protein
MGTHRRPTGADALTRRRLLLAAAGLAVVRPAHAETGSARAFVEAIYARYRGSVDKNPGILLDDAKTVRRYFTPELARLMIADEARAAKVQEVPALDGDPFVDAQDWDIRDLTIAVAAQGAGAALATVRFRNFGERKQVRLKLLRLSQGWRVDDVVFPGDEGTLRGLYAHGN